MQFQMIPLGFCHRVISTFVLSLLRYFASPLGAHPYCSYLCPRADFVCLSKNGFVHAAFSRQIHFALKITFQVML
jgi:hypothetical protein